MKRKFLKIYFTGILIAGFLESMAYAEKLPPLAKNSISLSPQTTMVLKVVSKKYKNLGNWSAAFSQETYSVGLGKGTFALGNFTFSPPSSFVYKVEGSDPSEFVSNGKEAWLIKTRPDPTQPTSVKHFEQLKNVELNQYLLLLRGIDFENKASTAKLLKSFNITSAIQNQNLELVLEPKVPEEILRVSLYFDTRSDAPQKAVLEDALGGKTTIIVTSHQKLATKPSPETFVAKIPPGSKVEKL